MTLMLQADILLTAVKLTFSIPNISQIIPKNIIRFCLRLKQSLMLIKT